MPLETIDDVLARLDEIVAECRRERSRLGYFAALYRKVTRAVRDGIHSGRFEDGPRMERLDVQFAQRYLEAYDQFRRGEPPSRCWHLAFTRGGSRRLLVLQHLFLGINAHINLDLGIAAARTCPGDDIFGLERDFREINRVLAELTDDVQRGLGTVSLAMRLIDATVDHTDKAVSGFSLEVAREKAWRAAQDLAPLTPADQAPYVKHLDRRVEALGHLICRPIGAVGRVAQVVAAVERKDPVAVIDCLT